MSLSNTTDKNKFNGNGVTASFAIPHDIIDNDSNEVEVYKINETDPDAITETLQVEGALQDYTLTGASPPGTPFDTTVVFNAGKIPTSDEKVLIRRKLAYTQPVDLNANAAYPAETSEKAYDRTVAQIQQLAEIVARAVVFRKSVPTSFTQKEIADPEADMIIGWNSDGTKLIPLITTAQILAAEGYADDAEAARLAALAAQAAAEAAETAADQAVADALAAQAAAEAAAASIGSDVTDAQAAAVAAAASAAAAATSETNAATSETNAETAKTSAETAQGLAEDARDAAAISAAAALVSENNAAASEAAAAQSAIDAAALGGPGTDFTIANNATAQDVTGMTVDSATYKAAKVFGMIRRTTALPTDLACYFEFGLYFDNATWRISGEQNLGEDSGVTFDVTTAGGIAQVNYTSTNEAGGTYTGTMRWRMLKC